MFTLVTTEFFLRRARKFLKRHPDLRERFAEVTNDLQRDPFASHLKYHHLGGKLKDVQAVSITYEYRIILTLMALEKEVVLLDVGG